MASTSTANLEVLAPTITCHTWNADRTKVALCPNNNEIHIYKVEGTNTAQWKLEHVLKEHDQTITALDWAPKTNRILSCAQDRNAYVWTPTEDNKGWKPTLVLLRINRAATCCKWSPVENKFAVGSGTKIVSVCYFEEANNWWVSKMLKQHKSTVLAVAWHPTDPTLIATACADFKCRVFSCYIKDIDAKPATRPPKFGEVTHEWACKSWVHSVAWSPSGSLLSFSSHDSTMTVVDVASNTSHVVTYRDLPVLAHFFTSETTIIATGYDFAPLVFSLSGDKWVYNGKCDKAVAASTTAAKSGFSSAFNKFSSEVKVGRKNVDDAALTTRHRNTITSLQPFTVAGDKITVFTTSALDGQLLFWDLKKDVETQVEGVTF